MVHTSGRNVEIRNAVCGVLACGRFHQWATRKKWESFSAAISSESGGGDIGLSSSSARVLGGVGGHTLSSVHDV